MLEEWLAHPEPSYRLEMVELSLQVWSESNGNAHLGLHLGVMTFMRRLDQGRADFTPAVSTRL